MIRLYAETDGRLGFASKDAAAERVALGELLAVRRDAEERLHEHHMAHLGVTDDPTRAPNASRTFTYVVPDKEEEALWLAWRDCAGI